MLEYANEMHGCEVDVMYENSLQSNVLYETIKNNVRQELIYMVLQSYTVSSQDPAMYIASCCKNKDVIGILYAAGFYYANSKIGIAKLSITNLAQILFHTGAIVSDKLLTGSLEEENPIAKAVDKIKDVVKDFEIIYQNGKVDNKVDLIINFSFVETVLKTENWLSHASALYSCQQYLPNKIQDRIKNFH